MMKKFLSELYGKELKDEDLPEELRPAKTNDKDNEDDKQQIVFKTDQPSFFMPFNHYGVERCQWTTNPKACPTCAEYARHNDGVYRVKDVPTLLAHPNCRCALSAYWKDKEIMADEKYMKYHPIKIDSVNKIPIKFKSYSVIAKCKDGIITQYRLYDEKGNASVDFGLTNHGKSKNHKIVPHKHEWHLITEKMV